MKVNAKPCIIAVLICIVGMYAHDAGTHWYIGLNTTEVWLNYDAAFCNISFYQNTYMEFYVLKLQHFQQIHMKHFSDARYFSQQFSLVETHEKLNYNN